MFTTLRDNHGEYANRLSGILGVDRTAARRRPVRRARRRLRGRRSGRRRQRRRGPGGDGRRHAQRSDRDARGIDGVAAVASLVVEAATAPCSPTWPGRRRPRRHARGRRRTAGSPAASGWRTSDGDRETRPLPALSSPAPVRARRSVGRSPRARRCGKRRRAGPGTGRQRPPDITELPTSEVNDVVYLRTPDVDTRSSPCTTSSRHRRARRGTASRLLGRFSEDHQRPPTRFAELTTDAGGEPYECPNSWLMDGRATGHDHIVGSTADGIEIPPTDDPDRDSLATARALETIAAATTAQQYVERLTDPALRAEIIAADARRAGGRRRRPLRQPRRPKGYVSPALTDGEEVGTDEQGFDPTFAIPPASGSSRRSPCRSAPPTTSASASASTSRRPPRTPTSTRAMTCPGVGTTGAVRPGPVDWWRR